jgi:3',5'-cyclic AMP phosphodiesterase CpdA
MKFVSDPDISVKIDRMKRRVRWKESLFQEKAISQTKLVVDGDNTDNPDFSFLVIGDTGCGSHLKHHPQRRIAKIMLQHRAESSFVIHTGDVVYQVGSSEYYPNNFVKPYREFLVGGENPQQLKYDRLTFKQPFFVIPGNHDYYDLPLIYGALAQATWLPRRFLRSQINLDVGWHGSFQGEAYAKAFLDYLADKGQFHLKQHLDNYYTAQHTGDRCLRYQPGAFTRLPNRYYTFRYGGIDFFALDSNTFNQPLSIPNTQEGRKLRSQLLTRKSELEARQQKIEQEMEHLDSNHSDDAQRLDDYYAKLEHIEESQRDIEKQLERHKDMTDWEQLEWLKDSLVASWQDEAVRGRIIFLHHPPYVTEATKWDQGQTLAIRDRLRQVFNDAIKDIGRLPEGRSVVDIVLSGHAHCMEHFYTLDTGHADSHTDWIVCGGSGHSLRRQRPEGAVLFADLSDRYKPIGQSHLFLGRNGSGRDKKRPYSLLRIDVQAGKRPQYTVKPYVSEWYRQQWNEYAVEPFVIKTSF